MGYEEEYRQSKLAADHELQTFYLHGEERKFQCIPSKATNFDVFMLSNPQISMEKATAIWEYYRSLFLVKKLSGGETSSFRKTLQRFIENKPYKDGDGFNSDRTRQDDIQAYIGLARWLELQFNVDTAIDQLSDGCSVEKLEQRAQRILGTVPFNNYISYFSNNIHDKLKDPTDYDTRKLLVRSVYEYTHKQIRWYVCASEFGPVKVWVHTKHNAFLPMFENMVKNGVNINVVTSKILLNIDESTPYIKIENFFIDP